MSKNLKRDFISGIKWTAISKFGIQIVQFAVTFLLVRLLSPEEFGLMGLAGVFLFIANQVNQLGIGAAIIQKKDIDEPYLSSAFWTNLIVGSLLTAIVFILSWPAAGFFNNNALRPMLQVLSIVYLLGSLRIVQNAIFNKKLQFKKIALIEVITVAVSGIVSVVLATNGFGVWSLVYGQIANTALGLILAWSFSSWRPKPIFSVEKFKELFTFGFNVLATNILSAVNSTFSFAIIGKYLSVISLGIFSMSMHIVYFPSRFSTMILSPVIFPVLSHIKEDNIRFRRAYSKVLTMISLVTFPALVGMACVASEFVPVVLGAKWLGVVMPLRILCIVGMIDSLVATVGSVFCSKGRPDLELRADFVLMLLLAIFLFIGIHWGLLGVVLATAVQRLFSLALFLYLTKPLIQHKISDFIGALFPVIRNSSIMGLVMILYKTIFLAFFTNEFVILTSTILIGCMVYLGLIRGLDKDIYKEIKQAVLSSLKKPILKNSQRLPDAII